MYYIVFFDLFLDTFKDYNKIHERIYEKHKKARRNVIKNKSHSETYFLQELQLLSSPNSIQSGFISSHMFGNMIFISSESINPAHL